MFEKIHTRREVSGMLKKVVVSWLAETWRWRIAPHRLIRHKCIFQSKNEEKNMGWDNMANTVWFYCNLMETWCLMSPFVYPGSGLSTDSIMDCSWLALLMSWRPLSNEEITNNYVGQGLLVVVVCVSLFVLQGKISLPVKCLGGWG